MYMTHFKFEICGLFVTFSRFCDVVETRALIVPLLHTESLFRVDYNRSLDKLIRNCVVLGRYVSSWLSETTWIRVD